MALITEHESEHQSVLAQSEHEYDQPDANEVEESEIGAAAKYLTDANLENLKTTIETGLEKTRSRQAEPNQTVDTSLIDNGWMEDMPPLLSTADFSRLSERVDVLEDAVSLTETFKRSYETRHRDTAKDIKTMQAEVTELQSTVRSLTSTVAKYATEHNRVTRELDMIRRVLTPAATVDSGVVAGSDAKGDMASMSRLTQGKTNAYGSLPGNTMARIQRQLHSKDPMVREAAKRELHDLQNMED